MRALMVAAAMALAMEAAQAQPPMPSQYAWSKGANTTRLYLHKYSLIDVKTGTCVGSVDGPAKVVGRTVVMSARKTVYAEQNCVLHITFNRSYTRAYVKTENCSEWSGASCGFDGALARQ